MRILQLSDPHLLADPLGHCRGRSPWALLRLALEQAWQQLDAAGQRPDQLLITGDLCQDESWGGYVRLGELLTASPLADLPPPWLLGGNHDHGQRLRAALGRRAVIAPAMIACAGWQVLLLDSQVPGRLDGRLGPHQLAWLERALQRSDHPLLVALHHPPGAIGDSRLDGIALSDGQDLLDRLQASGRLRGVVFGHVHQHWQGRLPGPAQTGPGAPLLACPSTLCAFAAVQPCPLGRADDPGARLLELTSAGELRHRLLRWSPPDSP